MVVCALLVILLVIMGRRVRIFLTGGNPVSIDPSLQKNRHRPT
jgi:hypothetical protein